ncbi:uncharacterized protein LOC128671591 isoform X2 [Plodia interpunctella]|uniref:uncharacterized protein LOC128671591 isoform X2 n=1 Tax=Plodia interpunctella TaxID=58824 RepID=UPI00236833D5|nr:uncharacterized protein LOC128671591 isoform X2 [Plodia interpunctella]
MVSKKCFENTDDEDELPTIDCREIRRIICSLAAKDRLLSERERRLNEKLCELQCCNGPIINCRGIEQKVAVSLAEKEQELLKKERQINQKLNKLRCRQDLAVKKQLQAAAKLKIARKQLFTVLEAKEKVEKCCNKKRKQNKKKKRKHSKEKRSFTSKIFHCLLKPTRNSKKGKAKVISFFKYLVGKPCPCMQPGTNKRLGPFSQRLLGVLPCGCVPHWSSRRPVAHRSRWSAAAGDCYLMTLRNPPHPWLYHRWPMFYPHYLSLRHQWRNLGYVLLFLAGIVFWTPLLLCLYLCICICCSDCH